MAENYLADNEVQFMLDDIGRPITVSGVTAKGYVRRADERILEGTSLTLGSAILVLVKRDVFPALVVGGAITVDGTAMKVAAIYQTLGGPLKRILCAVA